MVEVEEEGYDGSRLGLRVDGGARTICSDDFGVCKAELVC